MLVSFFFTQFTDYAQLFKAQSMVASADDYKGGYRKR